MGPIESYNEGYSVITNEYGYEQTDDYNGWVVYGLKENLTAKSLFSDFVTVQGDGYAVVTPSSGNIAGTGSVIKVYDRNGTETTDDDTFVEQFYVIIYGDNNGDGFITREDAKITYDEAAGLTHWSNIGFNGGIDYSAPKTRASSLAHLGAADAISASIMEDYYYQLLKIDQVTG